MRNLFSALRDALASGKMQCWSPWWQQRLHPTGSRARMVVTGQGRLCGTIGGGAVEYRSQQVAQELLRTGGAHLEHFRLHENQSRIWA
jgi:xanthine dehydrogenase accessory factor